uniref:Transcobalamin-2-like n=1 Tax=Ciona intestinalis TaxID=7719 RepID=F6UPX6_CIOIN|nr:transcobalamin-2-like [Ciona intestinalis]|eukprot:XP_002130272.1 transcobalamin-2-like [Ciona intestinalis]
MNVLYLFVCLLVNSASCQTVCDGGPPSAVIEAKINEGIDRLMALRNQDWGWVNTPQAVLGLQLGRPGSIFGLNMTLSKIETEIGSQSNRNVGKLALYAMALKAICEDPSNFRGINVMQLVQQAMSAEFRSQNGTLNSKPRSHWYQLALGFQAQCVLGDSIVPIHLSKLIQYQNMNGSFGHSSSVDVTSMALLALSCVRDRNEVADTPILASKVNLAIQKAIVFLGRSVISDRNNVWFGNKYSTPGALLALKEANRDGGPNIQYCSHVVESMLRQPLAEEFSAAVAQMLPALNGNSVLSLMGNVTCPTPDPIPDQYQPADVTSLVHSCNDFQLGNFFQEFFKVRINVRLSVITPDTNQVPYNVIEVPNVEKDNTLLQVLQQAQCNTDIEFETLNTAWGAMLVSVNGVRANPNKREYWALVDGSSGSFLPTGVSTYRPSDDEHIALKLATW